MISPPAVRRARPEDAPAMAQVLVRCWQETYRGIMRDAVLDDPGLVAATIRAATRVPVLV
jgi:hypothetical protein